MGALTYRPVVVEVAEFVGQSLHVVRLQSRGVIDDVEVGGRDCSLTDTLTDQEEVIPAMPDTVVIVLHRQVRPNYQIQHLCMLIP